MDVGKIKEWVAGVEASGIRTSFYNQVSWTTASVMLWHENGMPEECPAGGSAPKKARRAVCTKMRIPRGIILPAPSSEII